MTADEVIRLLGLERHPEGGWYRETFRDPSAVAGGRAASTAIYFLLREGEVSAWHRVDATEVWHWYAGAPLQLQVAAAAKSAAWTHELGPGLAEGQRPQAVVASRAWQRARSRGAWSLAGCTVAPGFEFAGFELDVDGRLPRAW